MNIWQWLGQKLAPYLPKQEAPKKPSFDAALNIVAALNQQRQQAAQPVQGFAIIEPQPGVLPKGTTAAGMAMDYAPQLDALNALPQSMIPGQSYFRGFPFLAMLAQQPEYRKIAETIAREMTRKGFEIKSTDDSGSRAKKCAEIAQALKTFEVADKLRHLAELDAFFGRGHLLINVDKPGGGAAADDPEEMKTPLLLKPEKVKKGALRGFAVIEPVWCYPTQYNSTNPGQEDFFRPESWFVMGKPYHGTRLLRFVSREVPDLFKAAYAFAGLSLSQMAEPYVNNWLRTRDSVSDLIHGFSITSLVMDMSALLSGDATGGELMKRIQLFQGMRDNMGLNVLDIGDGEGGERLEQVNTPLSGLSELQAQAQEQMASITSIPLVQLLGITPSGLNASSEGEIKVFAQFIHAMQVRLFGAHLKTIVELVQLHLFGEVDETIYHEFAPIDQMTEAEAADVESKKADTDSKLIAAGVLAPDESRQRLAADPGSDYHGLDVNREMDGPDDDQPDEGGDDGNAE